MNRKLARDLNAEWRRVSLGLATLQFGFMQEFEKRVASARKGGKQESEYKLFLAFNRDVDQCRARKIKPVEVLERLDTHFRKWMANDQAYLGEPAPRSEPKATNPRANPLHLRASIYACDHSTKPL